MVTLDPTQCGSPIVTLDGEIVALNIARAGRTEMYALPASVIVPLIADLRSGKLPPTTNPAVHVRASPREPTSRPTTTPAAP
jgi:hypothetical protein